MVVGRHAHVHHLVDAALLGWRLSGRVAVRLCGDRRALRAAAAGRTLLRVLRRALRPVVAAVVVRRNVHIHHLVHAARLGLRRVRRVAVRLRGDCRALRSAAAGRLLLRVGGRAHRAVLQPELVRRCRGLRLHVRPARLHRNLGRVAVGRHGGLPSLRADGHLCLRRLRRARLVRHVPRAALRQAHAPRLDLPVRRLRLRRLRRAAHPLRAAVHVLQRILLARLLLAPNGLHARLHDRLVGQPALGLLVAHHLADLQPARAGGRRLSPVDRRHLHAVDELARLHHGPRHALFLPRPRLDVVAPLLVARNGLLLDHAAARRRHVRESGIPIHRHGLRVLVLEDRLAAGGAKPSQRLCELRDRLVPQPAVRLLVADAHVPLADRRLLRLVPVHRRHARSARCSRLLRHGPRLRLLLDRLVRDVARAVLVLAHLPPHHRPAARARLLAGGGHVRLPHAQMLLFLPLLEHGRRRAVLRNVLPHGLALLDHAAPKSRLVVARHALQPILHAARSLRHGRQVRHAPVELVRHLPLAAVLHRVRPVGALRPLLVHGVVDARALQLRGLLHVALARLVPHVARLPARHVHGLVVDGESGLPSVPLQERHQRLEERGIEVRFLVVAHHHALVEGVAPSPPLLQLPVVALAPFPASGFQVAVHRSRSLFPFSHRGTETQRF